MTHAPLSFPPDTVPQIDFSPRNLARCTSLISAVAVSFLFSPQPRAEQEFCGQYIRVGSRAGFIFNCDSPNYCVSAKSPSLILRDKTTRQSRPLFIALAAVVGHPLQLVVDAVDLPMFHGLGEKANRYLGFHIGFIVINFVTILLSLLLFESIVRYACGVTLNCAVIWSFLWLLVANEITKVFFWTAHQQFFSLLTPLMTIWPN